jgi:hypothetical protein
MDHYPFEFNIKIIGLEVDEFIELLKKEGYKTQAKDVEQQFDKQLRKITK